MSFVKFIKDIYNRVGHGIIIRTEKNALRAVSLLHFLKNMV